MPSNMPLMPLIFIALLLMPFRLSSNQLKALAFFIWLTGGFFLAFRGGFFMWQDPSHVSTGVLVAAVAAAVVLGSLKGKFVLSKTSQRNIERLDALQSPQRPLAVYSLRSWILISLMICISIALNLSGLPLVWRGVINLGIGMALIMSSLAYLQALGTKKAFS